MVERNLAKVEVAGPNPVFRSEKVFDKSVKSGAGPDRGPLRELKRAMVTNSERAVHG